MWSLGCLLLVWPLTSTLVRRATRWGGVRRDDTLTMSGHGIVHRQAPSVELSLSPRPCQRGLHEGKERPNDPEGLPFPLVLLFSPVVTRAFPWPIKGKAGHPIKGHRTTSDQRPLASNLEHIAEQQLSSRYPFVLSTKDMGPVPLSPVCNPYYELFSASNMSNSNELNVGTFCPNQYKPRVLLAHHPSQTRNIRNLLVGVYSKHQH